jgi:hypothetical protein
MLHLVTDADTGHIVASVLTSRDTDDLRNPLILRLK